MNGPVGLGARSRVLRPDCRTVLVVVPFLVAGIRLMDVLRLLESDHRVMVVFTVAPASNGAICHGPEEFVRARGGLLLPWHQAVQCEFDLVLAASETAVEQLHGRLMLLPHGANALPSRLRARSAGPGASPTHRLDRGTLIHRGRLLPAALPLTHEDELTLLRSSCPEAVGVSLVAGDVCFDRLMVSTPWRERYRRALGVRPDQRLVVVTSTWQPQSALGRHPDLLEWLLDQLPSGSHRVAAVLHPNIWGVTGTWQVRTWMADCLRQGLLLLPPEEGWRAALVAADVVVGDHGSVTSYGAALGRPVLLPSRPEASFLRPGSLAESVSREAFPLRFDLPPAPQIDQAVRRRPPGQRDRIASLVTSRPGRSARILRRAMYRLLELPEPTRPPVHAPVPPPTPLRPPDEPPRQEPA
ncbi:hypothetical protein [Streptomyces sp. NPDC005438]|uniref:hypothetical protein n=1 Tax=Streptomyces sp. NPDC005438 TaxID=3156880 RepID=UPI0033AB1A75